MLKYNVSISKYESAVATTGIVINLGEELKCFESGKYKSEILKCRKYFDAGDKINYKKAKTYLPALTFSGEFTGSHKKDNLKQYSNFIIIDLDALKRDEIEDSKRKLFEDIFVAAVWISPSGCGLKVLVAITNGVEEHKKCFDTLSNYINENYSFEVDKSGSDVCRLCFVSFDENLLLKEDIVAFDFTKYYVEPVIEDEKRDVVKAKEKKYVSTQTQSDKVLFKSTENRNLQSNRTILVRIIKYLAKNKLSITGDYNDWFRVACAIANSFTSDLGEKYYLQLCRLDGELHDEYKSQYLLEYCYRNRRVGKIEFSTIIFLAKQKGFEVNKRLLLP